MKDSLFDSFFFILDMILIGRPAGTEEALRMGLANRVVPSGQSRERAEALAL